MKNIISYMVYMNLLDKNVCGIFQIASDLSFTFKSVYSCWDNNCNLEHINLLLCYFPESVGDLKH